MRVAGKIVKNERGVALIVVLLIIAIVAVIATNVTSRNQINMRRTINLAAYDQGYWYGLSAEELARKVLKQDLDDSNGKVHLQQYWALSNVVFPVDGGEIAGKISDMRSCFNLNALAVSTKDLENGQPKMPLPARQFKALLVTLGMDDFAAERLSQTLKDYVDEDTVSSPFGAEDAEYEARKVPYRAANTLMQHKSELRAVIGFTEEIYRKLSPYVCVIPGNDRQVLNINTLKLEQAAILVGMFDGAISQGEAEGIINQRPADGFDTIEDFWQIAGVTVDEKIKSSIVLDSKYFLLEAATRLDDRIFRLDSVLGRIGGNQLDVLTRQYGGQQ